MVSYVIRVNSLLTWSALFQSGPNRAGVSAVYINPIYRYRMGRMAWSLLRHPRRSREFPAKHERLITADELLRFAT